MYISLWNVIVDQLWSYQDQNILNSNHEHLASIFGITADIAQDIDAVPEINLDNGLTDGGAIYFDGDAAKFMKADAAGAYVEFSGIDLKSELNYIKGDQFIITGMYQVNSNSVYETTRSSTDLMGYTMPRDGSVLAVSYTFYANSVSGGATTNSMRPDVYKNDSLWLTGTSTGTVAATTRYSSKANYTRGDQTFAQGDRLEFHHRWTGTGTSPALTGGSFFAINGILDD